MYRYWGKAKKDEESYHLLDVDVMALKKSCYITKNLFTYSTKYRNNSCLGIIFYCLT